MAAAATQCERGTTLFILAHPDDELAFAPALYRLARQAKPVRLIYLADGALRSASAAVRHAESEAALASIGIDRSSLSFLGSQQGIEDGHLYKHLCRGLEAIERLVPPNVPIAGIFTLAWEGGHPDHDSAHLIAAAFAAKRGLEEDVWQVAFYRAADRLPAPAFSVSAPLAANGPVQSSKLTLVERRLARRMMRHYRSQWRSFIGLGPFIIWRSLTRSRIEWQAVRYDRLSQRPTERPLLYEVRNGIAFGELLEHSAELLTTCRASLRRMAEA
ncbi:MAG: PIG-L family deacetylase [Sphingomonas sp.]|nr:PIG-L family deacetylase [Sphingomonas sp.]